MKKVTPLQIPSKKYHSEYRQIRKLWTGADYQVLLLKNILSRQRYITIKRYFLYESQMFQLLKEVQGYTAFNEVRSLCKLVGYSVGHLEPNRKNVFRAYLSVVYQFGDMTLQDFIKKNHRSFHKKESINFIKKLSNAIIEVLGAAEEQKRIELGYLFLDHQLILVNHYGEVREEIKFCYCPFWFVKEHKIINVNFHDFLYSSKQLRQINRENKDRPPLPPKIQVQDIILQSERETEASSNNCQTLQKVGLCLLKSFFLFCQDIEVEQNHFQFYCMNEQFDVDFNWNLINQYLTQCQQYRQYAQIGHQIRFMLKQNQEERTFKEYRGMLKQIKISSQTITNHNNNNYIHIKEQQLSPPHNKQHPSPTKSEQPQSTYFLKLREIESKLEYKSIQEIDYQDGSQYRGQVQSGQRQGLGIYTFAQGDIFAGLWLNDSMEGKGYYYFTNHERYQGEIKAGVKEGSGVYHYKNGDIYTGMWKDDAKEGNGQFYCANTQQVYKGDFHNNHKQGKGTINYLKGQRFQGIFNMGVKNGEGTMFDVSGRLFLKARWKNDNIFGPAELFMPNNDYYIGEMLDNKKHGKGIYKYNEGTVYEGQFNGDRQKGKGVFRYPNGDIYEGEVVNGLFDGKGRYLFREERLVYEGYWKGGVEHGQGSYLYKQKIQMQALLQGRELTSFKINKIY